MQHQVAAPISTSNVGQTPCTLSQHTHTQTHRHLPSCLTFESTWAIRGLTVRGRRLLYDSKGLWPVFESKDWRADCHCVFVYVETADDSFIWPDASMSFTCGLMCLKRCQHYLTLTLWDGWKLINKQKKVSVSIANFWRITNVDALIARLHWRSRS